MKQAAVSGLMFLQDPGIHGCMQHCLSVCVWHGVWVQLMHIQYTCDLMHIQYTCDLTTEGSPSKLSLHLDNSHLLHLLPCMGLGRGLCLFASKDICACDYST